MLHLVVSRSTEDLGWLHQLPASSRVHVYNHGQPLDLQRLPLLNFHFPLPNGVP